MVLTDREEPAWDSVSPRLSAPPPLSLSNNHVFKNAIHVVYLLILKQPFGLDMNITMHIFQVWKLKPREVKGPPNVIQLVSSGAGHQIQAI